MPEVMCVDTRKKTVNETSVWPLMFAFSLSSGIVFETIVCL